MKNLQQILMVALVTLVCSCNNSGSEKGNASNKKEGYYYNNDSAQNANGAAYTQTSFEQPYEVFLPSYNSFYSSAQILTCSFYPIGWSREGKFAYLIIHPDEARGSNHVELNIQDLTTDKIVYSTNSRDYENEDNKSLMKKAWNEMEQKVTAQLIFHKIEQENGVRLLSLPINQEGTILDCHVYNRMGSNQYYSIPCIEATVVSLTKNGALGKKIFGQKYETGDPNSLSRPLSNKIAGYLKSPFQNKIAFIYLTEYPGYEGPPSVQGVELIGCNLNY